MEIIVNYFPIIAAQMGSMVWSLECHENILAKRSKIRILTAKSQEALCTLDSVKTQLLRRA